MGLADEIALLRRQLKRAMDAAPRTVKSHRELKIATNAIETLMRAVSAEHRLSPRASRDLAENITRVLDHLGNQILPADRSANALSVTITAATMRRCKES